MKSLHFVEENRWENEKCQKPFLLSQEKAVITRWNYVKGLKTLLGKISSIYEWIAFARRSFPSFAESSVSFNFTSIKMVPWDDLITFPFHSSMWWYFYLVQDLVDYFKNALFSFRCQVSLKTIYDSIIKGITNLKRLINDDKAYNFLNDFVSVAKGDDWFELI